MRTMRLWKAAIAFSMTAALAACDNTLSLSGTGEAAVTMARSSDGPITLSSQDGSASRSVDSDTVESFMVTVTSVQFLRADASESDASGWTSVDIEEGTRIDLMALPEEGVAVQLIAEGRVAAGSYRMVRLFVSNPTITFKGDISFGVGNTLQGGVEYDVTIPSALQTGIKTEASFEVEASEDGGTKTNVDLLFDAGSTFSAVTVTGTGTVVVGPVIRSN